MAIALSKHALQKDYFIETEAGLEESDIVAYLAALRRVANVGGITVGEKNFEGLIITYLGISKATVKKAMKIAKDRAQSTSEIVSRINDMGFRICLLRDIYRMALADGKVSRVEKHIIDNCSRALGISSKLKHTILAHVDNEARLLRSFSQLIEANVKS